MKNVISIIVACMMSLVVASCGGSSNSSEADRIAQLEDSIARMNKQNETSKVIQNNNLKSVDSENTKSFQTSEKEWLTNYVGVWEMTDENGTQWHLTINSDESGYIESKGSNQMFYCGIERQSKGICCNFGNDRPKIQFPKDLTSVIYLNLYEDYAYDGIGAVNSRNPKLRLPIKRIK